MQQQRAGFQIWRLQQAPEQLLRGHSCCILAKWQQRPPDTRHGSEISFSKKETGSAYEVQQRQSDVRERCAVMEDPAGSIEQGQCRQTRAAAAILTYALRVCQLLQLKWPMSIFQKCYFDMLQVHFRGTPTRLRRCAWPWDMDQHGVCSRPTPARCRSGYTWPEATIKLNIALDHILRRVVSGP